MTPPQKMMLQSIVKYGATAVFCALFYWDFVRPMGTEHRAYLSNSIEQQTQHTTILETISKAQVGQANALETMAKSQGAKNDLMQQITESQDRLRETQEKALEILQDIHRDANSVRRGTPAELPN